MTIEDISDSFLMSMMDSAEELQVPTCRQSNVLSQLEDGQPTVFAGQLETLDGQVMPFSIGKTDIGNGKPRPFIHLSDHPSIANRHVTITTVQTKDGKFRASLRQNHPQATVMLGGSIIRPNVSYPVADEDEISLGEGFTFRLRMNNQTNRRASILGAPTPHYVPSPDSETSFELEEKERAAKREEFKRRLPDNEIDDSFLLKLVAGDDAGLVHQAVDTCPFSSDDQESPVQPPFMMTGSSEEQFSPQPALQPEREVVHEQVSNEPIPPQLAPQLEHEVVQVSRHENEAMECPDEVVDEKVARRRASKRQATEEVSDSKRFKVGPKKLVILKTSVEIDKSTETAVSALGGKIETKWSNKVEALVTSKIVRTTKFLCAINKGLAIFPKSILSEIRANRALPVLDEPSLWLNDSEGEQKYEFSLSASIEKARKRPLFRNFEIFFYKNGIGEFSAEEFRDLVTSAGGKVVSKLAKSMPEDENENENGGVIVIGCETNRAAAKAAGLSFFHKIEFIVDSCIKQKINFEYARITT